MGEMRQPLGQAGWAEIAAVSYLGALAGGPRAERPELASPLGQEHWADIAAASQFGTPRGRIPNGVAKMGQPPWLGRMAC